MDVSPNELRRETAGVLQEVNGLLKGANDRLDPAIKVQLLLAKSQCLNTLTILRDQGQQGRRR